MSPAGGNGSNSMTKRLLLLLFLLLCASSSNAQTFPITIHTDGAPGLQRTVYNSADEFPLGSGQVHWKGRFETEPAHAVHIECWYDAYGEHINQPWTWKCQLQAYKFAGIVEFVTADLIAGITWDGPVAPPFAGDPNSLLVVPFHITLDPMVGYRRGDWEPPHGFNPHGWSPVRIQARVRFPDGTHYDPESMFTVWSNVDPNAPIFQLTSSRGLNMVAAVDAMQVPGDRGPWGYWLIDFRNQIPLQPINADWWLDPLAYGYANNEALNSRCSLEARKDVDLHHGIGGTSITPGWLKPAELGQGKHNVVHFLKCSTGAGVTDSAGVVFQPNEELTILAKIDVTVGDVPPPPPPPLNPWQTLFYQPPWWVAKCVDPSGIQAAGHCWPFGMEAICHNADCTWTPIILP